MAIYFVVGYRIVVIGLVNWCVVVVGGISWMIAVGRVSWYSRRCWCAKTTVPQHCISFVSADPIRRLLPTMVSPCLLRLLLTSQLVSLVHPCVEKLKENL